MFQSTKIIDGFSTCFRQWRAEDTHCKFLHGYSIKFEVIFQGELDDRNWVMDFGFTKRSQQTIFYNNLFHGKPLQTHLTVDEWFKRMFDHTVVIASDDPEIELFHQLSKQKVIELRLLPDVGCEKFAKLVFEELSEFVLKETNGRVEVVSVRCYEHEKNSSIYLK